MGIGQLLVELESPELELEIKKLEKEIQNLESEKVEKQKLLESELQLFESEKRIIQNEVDSEVQQIESKITLNKTLSDNLVNVSAISDSLSELQLQKQSILDKGALEFEAINIRIVDTQQDHRLINLRFRLRSTLPNRNLNGGY